VTTLRYNLQNKQFFILMKISSKMAFENFKNFISFHETVKTKFSTHISKHNVAWADAYLRTKWHLDPSSRLDTIDMGRKLGVGGRVPV